jgi:hypothetical protein
MYDQKSKTFKLVHKDDLIESLIEYRICDIEEFYNEFEDKLDENTKKVITKMIEDRGDDDKINDDIKLLVFNNRNKVKHLLNQ